MKVSKSAPKSIADTKTVRLGGGVAPRVNLSSPKEIGDSRVVRLGGGIAPRLK